MANLRPKVFNANVQDFGDFGPCFFADRGSGFGVPNCRRTKAGCNGKVKLPQTSSFAEITEL
jgi:hypothetical protein